MQDFLNSFFSCYDWDIFIVHVIAAIILFYMVNWIGARSVSIGYMQMSITINEETAPAFNFIYKVLAPTVFYVLFIVAVQSAGLSYFVRQSYMIILYYWLFRTSVILLMGRKNLTHWKLYFVYWIASLTLSVWIYLLVEKVDKLLPSPRSLLDQMWILIFLFIYNLFNRLEFSREGTIKRKEEYINHQYETFKNKFGSLITKHCSNEFYEAVTYAIMIVENFNRPQIVRWVEYLRFKLTKKPHTLGIMQVRTEKHINNIESISMAIDIIKDAARKHKRHIKKEHIEYDSTHSAVNQIAGTYNCNNEAYINEVSYIYDIIEKKYNNTELHYNKIKP